MKQSPKLEYIELTYSIFILIKKYGLKYKRTSKGWQIKAIWRGGDGFNVHIYSNTNRFFDFVTKESGGFFELYCLLNDLEKNIKSFNILLIDLGIKEDVLSSYNNNEISLQIQEKRLKMAEFQKENDKKEEELKKIEQQNIGKIFYNSKKLQSNNYLIKKGINLCNDFFWINDIKEIKFDNKIDNLFLNNKLSKQKTYDYHYQNSMIIPIYHIKTKELISLQYFNDGNILKKITEKTGSDFHLKEFHKNTSPALGIYTIYNNNNNIENEKIIIICEGIATGFSLYLAVNQNNTSNHIPVVCCFTANNVKNVIDYLKNKKITIIVASDKDSPMIRNSQIYKLYGTGLDLMKYYKKNQNILFTTPEFPLKQNKAVLFFNSQTSEYIKSIEFYPELKQFSDFNDLHHNYGLKKASKYFWFSLANYIILNKLNTEDLNNRLSIQNREILLKYINRVNRILLFKPFDLFKTKIIEVDNFNDLFDNLKYLDYYKKNNIVLDLKQDLIQIGLNLQERN